MPLFGRSHDDSSGGSGVDPIAGALGHFTALSVPDRAAELLTNITAPLEQDALAMDALLSGWLPDTPWMDLSEQQRTDWMALARMLREAFQALVLARMLIRQEETYQGATSVTYVNSPDGLAALIRGDVAAVVARRLPV